MSLIVSLAIIIVAFKFSPYYSSPEAVSNSTQEIIKIDEIISTVQKPNIPPPPKTPEIIAGSIDNVPDDFLLPDIDDYAFIKLPDVLPTQTNVNLLDEHFIAIP